MKSVTAATFQPFATDVATRIDLAWGVWDQAIQTWIFHSDTAPPTSFESGYPPEGWLLRIEGNWTLIDAPSVDDMLSQVADCVQDAVMDETGKGWPECYTADGFAGLLVPRGVGNEIVWTLRGSVFCRSGELAAALNH